MILLIANEKGGCGKSSIAVNLAVMRSAQGFDILLVDSDKQQTATFWSAVRDENKTDPRISCIQKTGKIHNDLKNLAEKFDDIIVDTGGRDSAEVRSGMIVADILLCPFRASQFDIWTLDKLQEIVNSAKELNEKLKVIGLLNLTSTNPGVNETAEAQDFIREYDFIKLAETNLKDRIVWRKSVREGLAVTEYKPQDKKAVNEINDLYKEVFNV